MNIETLLHTEPHTEYLLSRLNDHPDAFLSVDMVWDEIKTRDATMEKPERYEAFLNTLESYGLIESPRTRAWRVPSMVRHRITQRGTMLLSQIR